MGAYIEVAAAALPHAAPCVRRHQVLLRHPRVVRGHARAGASLLGRVQHHVQSQEELHLPPIRGVKATRRTAMGKLRIVRLGFGTARQKTVLE
jgi:hypothetical protein